MFVFSFDGKMLPCTDKSKLMHSIEDKVPESTLENECRKSIIIDGMALVNKVQLTWDVKTCYDFKLLFMRPLLQEGKGFTEIRLVFDRYITSSLKEQCREKRRPGKQIKYSLKDSTSLEGVKLKEFLSHIETIEK